MIKRYLRNKLFSVARYELAAFLEEHEEELLHEFREQLRRTDEAIPEEESFIDVKMVPLGETIVKASLKAVREFLKGKASHAPHGTASPADADRG
jgi:hypothetical protein